MSLGICYGKLDTHEQGSYQKKNGIFKLGIQEVVKFNIRETAEATAKTFHKLLLS